MAVGDCLQDVKAIAGQHTGFDDGLATALREYYVLSLAVAKIDGQHDVRSGWVLALTVG